MADIVKYYWQKHNLQCTKLYQEENLNHSHHHTPFRIPINVVGHHAHTLLAVFILLRTVSTYSDPGSAPSPPSSLYCHTLWAASAFGPPTSLHSMSRPHDSATTDGGHHSAPHRRRLTRFMRLTRLPEASLRPAQLVAPTAACWLSVILLSQRRRCWACGVSPLPPTCATTRPLRTDYKPSPPAASAA